MGRKCIETALRYAHVKPYGLEEALVRVEGHRLALVTNPQNSAENTPPTRSPPVACVVSYARAT
jgi:hypothetical protein